MAKPADGATLDTGHALATSLEAVFAFLEGTGTAVDDLTGNGHDLTLNAAVAWETDGAGDAVVSITTNIASPATLASAITLASTGSWSIAFRAFQDTSGTRGMVCGDNTDTNDFVWFNGGTQLRFTNSAGGQTNFSGVTSFTTAANYVLVYTHTSGSVGTLSLYKDGSLVSTSGSMTGSLTINTIGNGYTSTTLALLGDITYLYVWSGRALNSTEVSSLHSDPYQFLDSGAPADSVTLTGFSRVWQRSGSAASIPVSGAYSAALADHVQCKVFLASDNSTIVDWTTVDSSLSGDVWSGSISVPQDGPYYMQSRLRDSSNNVLATSASSSTFLIGDIFLVTGQSNATGRGSISQSYTGTKTAWMVNESGTIANLANPWSTDPSASHCWGPILGTLIEASESACPIFIVNGLGGSAISNWDSPSGTRWTSISNQISTLSPNAIKACIFLQGESDAIAGTAGYQSAESTLATDIATLPGAPPMITFLLPEVSGATDSNIDLINTAKIANWNSSATRYGYSPLAIDLSDNLHYQSANHMTQLAAWLWLAVEDLCYGGANGRGPRISSAVKSGSDVILTFDRDLDTGDTSYTAAAFTVANTGGAARTVLSAARTGTRQVTVTCDGAIDGTSPTITFGSGNNATGGTVPRTTGIALPVTINSVSSQFLYAEPFYSQAITPADETAPTLASATINNAGTICTLSFTEAGSAPILPEGGITGFSLTASGGAVSISAASRTASTTAVLALSRVILSGEIVTISYASGNVTDSADPANSLATITNQSVTNNSTAASGSGGGGASLLNSSIIRGFC